MKTDDAITRGLGLKTRRITQGLGLKTENRTQILELYLLLCLISRGLGLKRWQTGQLYLLLCLIRTGLCSQVIAEKLWKQQNQPKSHRCTLFYALYKAKTQDCTIFYAFHQPRISCCTIFYAFDQPNNDPVPSSMPYVNGPQLRFCAILMKKTQIRWLDSFIYQ